MPKISKKHLNESNVLVKCPIIKNRKAKSIQKKVRGIAKSEILCNTTLKTSTSNDSVIYVGSYNLNENCWIDLTKTASEESFGLRRYKNPPTEKMLFNSFLTNHKLVWTSSSDCLSDSKYLSDYSLKKNSKSTSCLKSTYERKVDGQRSFVSSATMYPLNKKERHYIDRITELRDEDQSIIKHSLEIEEDINIMERCYPKSIVTNELSVGTLMKSYGVSGSDQFL